MKTLFVKTEMIIVILVSKNDLNLECTFAEMSDWLKKELESKGLFKLL